MQKFQLGIHLIHGSIYDLIHMENNWPYTSFHTMQSFDNQLILNVYAKFHPPHACRVRYLWNSTMGPTYNNLNSSKLISSPPITDPQILLQ